jgi:AcrR family transcriptional regulator
MSKGEETRREIVERALVLAGERGLEGLSLGTLAADLKLSKSGLFAHFRSKEALQIDVVRRAIAHFTAEVVMPALTLPRGEPRVRAMFERYLAWIGGPGRPGSCFFMALTQEYDDRPGAVRDLLVQSQRDWRQTLARACQIAVAEGHFRADLDTTQFAYELVGIGMVFQQTHKLLHDAQAERLARTAFAGLLARSRASAPPTRAALEAGAPVPTPALREAAPPSPTRPSSRRQSA